MSTLLELPTVERGGDDLPLVKAIDALIGPALVERNINQVGWWITSAYLQGMRRFEITDFLRGEVEVGWEEADGTYHLRWEELLTLREIEIGRLARLDTAPLASKRENSLESLRNSSVAQVLLDQVDSVLPSRAMAVRLIAGIIDYGTYGIADWNDPTRESPLAVTRELIPPWELLGVPAGYLNPTDLRAVCRTRLFPVLQLAGMPDVSLPTKDIDLAKLEIVELPQGAATGMSPAGPGFGRATSGALFSTFDETPKGTVDDKARVRTMLTKPGASIERFVRLRELFILSQDQTRVVRYIAKAGRKILVDVNYLKEGISLPFPIGIVRYHDTGSFYGRSFVGKTVPLFLELETLLEASIQEAADFRRFGYLLVPMDKGIDFNRFTAATDPVIIGYEQDLNSPRSGIEGIKPLPQTDKQARVLSTMGIPLIDRLVAQGPMFGGVAPGRADSGEAFNTLLQSGSTHLLSVAHRIEEGLAAMYRHTLYLIRERFRDTPDLGKGLSLTRVENSIAGIKLDAKTGRVVIESSQLPDPFEVNIGIRSNNPIQRDRRRSEALLMLNTQLTLPLEFIIMNYREGWDYPIGSRSVWENYVKAVLTNLTLFNDGETPGELPGADRQSGSLGVFFNARYDKPEVHLLAIDEFVSGPEFALASVAVRQAFQDRVDEIRQHVGMAIPPQLPPLADFGQQSDQALGPQSPQGF